jgi:hypothetical protein
VDNATLAKERLQKLYERVPIERMVVDNQRAARRH